MLSPLETSNFYQYFLKNSNNQETKQMRTKLFAKFYFKANIQCAKSDLVKQEILVQVTDSVK